MYLLDLPDDILESILDHLAIPNIGASTSNFPYPGDLVQEDSFTLRALALVCKDIYRLNRSRLFRHCALNWNNNEAAAPSGVIWQNVTLNRIVNAFTGRGAGERVSSLHLRWSITQEDLSLIPNLIKKCRQLQYLTLDLEDSNGESFAGPVENASRRKPGLPVTAMQRAFDELYRLTHLYLR